MFHRRLYAFYRLFKWVILHFFLNYRNGFTLVIYIFLLNLPVILIIIYLFTRNSRSPTPKEPIHFERKPMSSESWYVCDWWVLWRVGWNINTFCWQCTCMHLEWRIDTVLEESCSQRVFSGQWNINTGFLGSYEAEDSINLSSKTNRACDN